MDAHDLGATCTGTDFFDQLERRILPALRSGLIVLADRYIFTLIARAAVRGIRRDYLHGIYEIALRPDLTFWLNVRPEVAFDREFAKIRKQSRLCRIGSRYVPFE